MINFSVSDFGNLESTPSVEKNLKTAAAEIGNFFVPYYGMAAGTRVGNLLTAIAINGTKVVEALKNRRDVAAFETIWAKQADELAQYLNELNPSQWPRDLLSEMVVTLTKFWLSDFRARYEKDFAADSISLDNIFKVAVSGIPNHTNRGYTSIADLISRGIIAQYPLSFVIG
jgi:hypothetical protein